jgi:glutathione S-transferase
MKFYDNAVAPSPRRVRMFIAEKGLDIETVEIDIRAGDQFTDEFRAINPFCTVPVLELDDGTHLITTDGCYAWLEETFPEPPLLGRTVTEKGQIADALQIVMFHGQMAVSETLRNSMEAMVDRGIIGPDNYPQIPALADRGRQRGARFMSTLNTMIGDHGFVVGDAFSAADIDAFVYVTFAKWAKIEPEDGHTALKRWYEAISARPSAAL